MPQIKLAERAEQDIRRLYSFLAAKDRGAALRAVRAIRDAFKTLERFPQGCEVVDETQELRKLVIEFGKSGYSALYHYDQVLDLVLILAIKHQLEKDYGLEVKR